MSKNTSIGLKAGKPREQRKEKAIEELTEKNQMVRVNFDLDREEHIRLKIHAAKAGKSVADVLRELVAKIE